MEGFFCQAGVLFHLGLSDSRLCPALPPPAPLPASVRSAFGRPQTPASAHPALAPELPGLAAPRGICSPWEPVPRGFLHLHPPLGSLADTRGIFVCMAVFQVFLTVGSGLQVICFFSRPISASASTCRLSPAAPCEAFLLFFLGLLYCCTLVSNLFYYKSCLLIMEKVEGVSLMKKQKSS